MTVLANQIPETIYLIWDPNFLLICTKVFVLVILILLCVGVSYLCFTYWLYNLGFYILYGQTLENLTPKGIQCCNP